MPRLTKAQQERRAIIDEYGALDNELQPLRPKLRRLETLAAIIRSWFENASPDGSLSAKGECFEVLLGPRGFQTRIPDLAAVYWALGHDQFLQAAAITLKQLEARLDTTTVLRLTEKTRTGARSMVVRSL